MLKLDEEERAIKPLGLERRLSSIFEEENQRKQKIRKIKTLIDEIVSECKSNPRF